MGLPVRRIGIREARSRLGDLLDAVGQGVEWVITDRGRPVARLTAVVPDELSLGERLQRFEEAGRIAPAANARQRMPPPLPIEDDAAQRYLQADRGD
jgi:prevent-host-death family protein